MKRLNKTESPIFVLVCVLLAFIKTNNAYRVLPDNCLTEIYNTEAGAMKTSTSPK